MGLTSQQIQSEKPALSLAAIRDAQKRAQNVSSPWTFGQPHRTMFIVCERRLVPPKAAAVDTMPNNFSWRHEKISGIAGT